MLRGIQAVGLAWAVAVGLAAAPSPQSAPEVSRFLRLAASEIRAKEFIAAQKDLRLALARDPTSSEAYNLLGVCEASLGDFATARQSFETSIHLNPQVPISHVNFGNLLFQLHHERAALAQFEAALALDPGALTRDARSYRGFNLLGLCFMDEHRYSDASVAFTRAVRINPGFAPGYANLGLARVALNRDREAARAFLSALRINSEDLVALSNLGMLYARQQNFSEAAKYLEHAHSLAPNKTSLSAALAGAEIHCHRDADAEAIIEELVKSGRLDASTRLSLAASWLEALEVNRAVQLARADPEVASRFYRLAYRRAEALFEDNRSLAAARLLDAIRNLAAPDAAYFGLLGSVYYTLDRPKEASENFQQAIRLDPSDPDYYFKLGMVFLKHDTPKPAIYIFQSALQSQPKSAKLWFGLGLSYYFASNTSAGERDLRKAINLAPNYEIVYIVLGDLLRQTGRLAESAAVFEKAIRIQPDSFLPYYCFGAVASGLGSSQLTVATSMLRKAVLLNPKFAEAHYELGKCLAEEGHTAEAAKELQKSLELKSGLARSHYQLGRLYEKMGQSTRAREQFRLFAAASEKPDSHDLIRRLIFQIGEPQR